MEKTVYVTRSHTWLHARLFEHAAVPEGVRLVPEHGDADLIVYLHPPWPDNEAPDRLRDFMPHQLLRTCVFSQSDTPVPWAPGMYASLRQRRSPIARAFSGGFYVAHHLRESGGLGGHLNDARALSPDLLWSFVGTTSNASVRRQLLDLDDGRAVVEDTQRFSDTLRWAWDSTHRDEAQEAFRRYATTLGCSKFVVCPRGVGLSSIRLFEALEVGRCPVIVADGWLPPPFVDWDSCSIRVPENRVDRIPEILRGRESEAAELGRNARLAWERFFSPESQLATIVLGCLEINHRLTRGTRLVLPLSVFGDRVTLAQVARRGRRLVRHPQRKRP